MMTHALLVPAREPCAVLISSVRAIEDSVAQLLDFKAQLRLRKKIKIA